MVEAKGIMDDRRYFGRLSRESGKASRRQVSLIEREQLSEHASALGLGSIAPGAARSNIETLGIPLAALLGKEIEIGDAVLFLNAHREPCAQMDAICQGLRERMLHGRQGVMAEVRRAGTVRVGDSIRVRP
jgi:MOSC domain-containing protein YiiM